MDDRRDAPGPNDASARLVSPVEQIQSPEGTAYGFSLIDEESMAPCFRIAFETQQDAEHGRSLMAQIVDNCLFFEVADDAEQGGPSSPPPSRWR